jgi:hypothetical protein
LYYLHTYFILGTEKKQESMEKLEKKLKEFVLYNPRFGRKKIHVVNKFDSSLNKEKKMISFNVDHKSFQGKFAPHITSSFIPYTNINNRNNNRNIIRLEEEDEEVVEDAGEDEEIVEEDEAVVDEDAIEEDAEGGVFEVEINGETYYTDNEQSGDIYNTDDNGDPNEIVGKFVEGVPVWN